MSSLPAKLQALAALRRDGALTEHEFSQAKAALLAGGAGVAAAAGGAGGGAGVGAALAGQAFNAVAGDAVAHVAGHVACEAAAGAAAAAVGGEAAAAALASAACSIQRYMAPSDRPAAGTFGLFPPTYPVDGICYTALPLRAECRVYNISRRRDMLPRLNYFIISKYARS